jgi:membrane-associated phospholipid phosphatase
MTDSHAQADAEIPLPRLRTISQLWSCAAVLGGLGVAALAIDVPLAACVQRGSCPNFVEKLCGLSETFGHGLGVALIVVVIGVLDPWHRHVIPRILAASLGSGMLANIFKLLLARFRPQHVALNGSGLDTFSSWFPLLGNGSWEQSFPSSHTAVAAGLAIVLACYYPRGRWLFPVFAMLAGCERVVDQYHFLSDVFWGAAVGCIFAPLCVYGSGLARAFDRLEMRLLARSAALAAARGPQGRTSRAARAPADVTQAA